mmetsp:Transcript_77880/g.152876  ORF Transcript_77880/g.152876 Transcript_77880/m.152876 type:complete len:204 (-) Transcript_77880:12-623(-)
MEEHGGRAPRGHPGHARGAHGLQRHAHGVVRTAAEAPAEPRPQAAEQLHDSGGGAFAADGAAARGCDDRQCHPFGGLRRPHPRRPQARLGGPLPRRGPCDVHELHRARDGEREGRMAAAAAGEVSCATRSKGEDAAPDGAQQLAPGLHTGRHRPPRPSEGAGRRGRPGPRCEHAVLADGGATGAGRSGPARAGPAPKRHLAHE